MLASRAIICPNLPRMSGQHLEETEIHNDAHEPTEAPLAVADDGPQYQNLKHP